MVRTSLIAVASLTVLLAGCASTNDDSVSETQSPAPTESVVTSAEHDAAVATCKAAALDYIADDYAHVVSEDITLEQIWGRQHSPLDPTVEAIPGGYSVLFEGSGVEGGFPDHLCELVDGQATITTIR